MAARKKSHVKPHKVFPGRAESGRMLPTRQKIAAEAANKSRDRKQGVKEGSAKDNRLDAMPASRADRPAPNKRGTPAHPGFAAVQKKIAAQTGVSTQSAGAILAASTRNASTSARKKNPNLNRVKG